MILLTGCGLYTHGGGDDICLEGTPGAVPALELRDPSTGVCQAFGGGGGCGTCQPCAAVGTVEPDWAMCGGACEALDETHCLAQAGCHAAYTENPAADQLPQFWQCWGVPPSGPISTGTCTGLDAQACSDHDNCSTLYAKTSGTSFEECLPERTAYAPGECAPAVDCLIVPPGPPACPAGTIAGITPGASPCLSSSYTGYCIPQADCGQQIDPGTCANAACDIVGPACPSGTVPGVRNACYSGFCIPASTCPQAACAALATEAACKARTDCVPIYQGTNCTCTPDTCTCAIETYERCDLH